MTGRSALIVSAPSAALDSALRRNAAFEPRVVGCAAALRDALALAVPPVVIVSGTHDDCRPALDHFLESRARGAIVPFVVVASESSERFAIDALRAGAADYLVGPLDGCVLHRLLERWSLACDRPAVTSLLQGERLVGSSEPMLALRRNIEQVAKVDCNVLITGETGTGKELVAQLIHQNSPRRTHPLVSINCAAIPDSLLESELFGYERGAFTGANTVRQGKLVAADKGTVFFDEIGDMSAYAQAKVLRAIEAKEVQRLGAVHSQGTDIRVVAATHRPLDTLAGTDAFRSDLFFRLNVGRLYLPPLRDRKSDIAELVQHLLDDLNRRLDARVTGVTSGAFDRLLCHHWPGNVRELKNVFERVFISRRSGEVTENELPSFGVEPRAGVPARPPDGELECLLSALHACRWNKSRTAQKLNWSRMTLYRKMAKYKLTSDPPPPAGRNDGAS
jgi:DNA-binding NtrC family response regulator